MVHRLILSYHGKAYAGWQRQLNALAVQQVVEEALEDLFNGPIRIAGASRTDSGVHARGQAAHLVLEREFPSRGLVGGLNARLPPDIRVLAAHRMPEGFHALRCAEAKMYRYRLHRARVLSPLDSDQVVRLDSRVDVEGLQAAAALLVGRHDFAAFALAGGSHRHSRRRILEARWLEVGPALDFVVIGEGFLRGMVRSLVGTILEVGSGRRSLENLASLLEGAPRSAAGPTAPAQGLVLEKVAYGDEWKPLED